MPVYDFDTGNRNPVKHLLRRTRVRQQEHGLLKKFAISMY